MKTYRVAVTVNGTYIATYTVEAEREGMARTAAARALLNDRRAGKVATPKATSADGIDFMEYTVEAA